MASEDEVLDVTGYECPQPQVLFTKAMKRLEDGRTLEVRIGGPVSLGEIKNLCDRNGYEYEEVKSGKMEVKIYVLLVKKPMRGVKNEVWPERRRSWDLYSGRERVCLPTSTTIHIKVFREDERRADS